MVIAQLRGVEFETSSNDTLYPIYNCKNRQREEKALNDVIETLGFKNAREYLMSMDHWKSKFRAKYIDKAQVS